MRSFKIGSTPFHNARAGKGHGGYLKASHAVFIPSVGASIRMIMLEDNSRRHRYRCSPRVRCPRHAQRYGPHSYPWVRFREIFLQPSRGLGEAGMFGGVFGMVPSSS